MMLRLQIKNQKKIAIIQEDAVPHPHPNLIDAHRINARRMQLATSGTVQPLCCAKGWGSHISMECEIDISLASIQLRRPAATDGLPLHKLVAESPPLDPNSSYCNLLQCTHFADTAVAAEFEGQLVGFVSGYLIPPTAPTSPIPAQSAGSEGADTLFIWQVVVAEKARGLGLARAMLDALYTRHHALPVRYLETTITKDNKASRSLFRSFAEARKAELTEQVMFDKEKHFANEHDTEYLIRIGPFC